MELKESHPPIYELEEGSTPLYSAHSRCCFCFHSCFPSRNPSSPLRPSFWERVGSAQHDHRWWARGLRALTKLRQWSEIAAGPRWKTFIRRFNRTRSATAGGGPQRRGKFQYDALSYSLNFDEYEAEEDEHSGFRNFSARYASVPAPATTTTATHVSAVDMSGKGKEVPVFG